MLPQLTLSVSSSLAPGAQLVRQPSAASPCREIFSHMCGRPRRRSGHRLTLERGLTRAAASTASTEAAEQSAGAPAGRPPRSDLSDVAVVIVDHGSRRQASNEMLEQFGEVFQLCSDHKIVEIAHMEIAEPSIMQAVEKCVARGATEVVIAPYFLSRYIGSLLN